MKNFVAALLSALLTAQASHAATLVASDAAASDFLGFSVSVSGTNALVGAYGDDFGATNNRGSAYVFRGINTNSSSGTNTENAKLRASDGAADDFFGYAVSMAGPIGLVGAYGDNFGTTNDQGSAYLFRGLDTVTGTTVTQDAKLTASDGAASNYFGGAVSVAGTLGVVGAYGATVSGSTNRGAAYVFRDLDTATGTVTQNAKLVTGSGNTNDYFGAAVSVSGTMGLVGAYGNKVLRDFVNRTNQGAAYVFRGLDTATGTITQDVRLTASDGEADDFLGYSVGLSGSLGLAGAYGDNIGANADQGSAYLFRNLDTATGNISENSKLTASDGAASDFFGASVAVSGTTGLVGAYGDDSSRGSAYLFLGLESATGTITESVKITAQDRVAGDLFGRAVSLDGDLFLVGAPGADLSKTGDDGKAYSGSVSSMTTLDAGSASRTISGVNFVTRNDWIIGQTTDSSSVTLSSSHTAVVTNAGKAVYIGKEAGSDGNTLVMAGSLTATTIHVGAAGNSNNTLQLGTTGNFGTLSTGSTIINHGTVVFSRTGTTTQGTHFGTAGISGTGSIVKLGAGTLTLNATNTFGGSTTVSNGTLALVTTGGGALAGTTNVVVHTGAILLLSASDQVNDASAVTLSGGTIRRGAGVSEVFGDLNLTAGSALNYGTGAAGTLRFGTYTPTHLLTVSNFAPGNSLVFGSNLEGSIANASFFSFDTAIAYAWNEQSTTFTVTAIPEPTTVAAALSLLGLCTFAAARGRRRAKWCLRDRRS